ncbi:MULTISPECIES: hypothetical protein [unclassified Chryseobacterium]|uniref:hypothetical protein n=1 Tax=unclassified Chryseobacterium TaxID=2593645 RepID=UPI00100A73DB|nr:MULTISPECIES: hypothetical protein [unclassified Chryseobacterium]RXM52153.1 hypothetical protein BOQ64_09935 [Chryseobacterium sp. CH25]RXM64066.1 hypothetical protein BOQ60_14305 [Chryseobacterium sp. CH1]
MKTKQELKQYFENGDIPKQEEFWEWQESYWHKDEKIPSDKLAYDFSQKADLVNGVVPASQLPSYVDDVLEFDSLSNLPQQGESGKIYITKDSNKIYRWTGARYIDITQGELGTLQSVTDRGNETTKSIKVQGISYGGSSSLNNIMIGQETNDMTSQANYTISIGKDTNPLGNDHVVIGHNSFVTDNGSQGNTVVGNFSMQNGLYSNENTVLGYSAFGSAKGASRNTVLGAFAGYGGGDNKYQNILIGSRAGINLGPDSSNNVIIGSNSDFGDTQLLDSLYIHNVSARGPVEFSQALISGNFVNKYINIDGKFSITPNKIPAADTSFTKNIVARPDGTFGWEDKAGSEYIPLAGTAPTKPVTGDIVIKDINNNSFTRLSKGSVFCSDNAKNGTLVGYSSVTFLEQFAGPVAEISKGGIITAEPTYVITCGGAEVRGLSGASDYTYNVKDLDYIQKKYADKQHSYTKEEVKTGGLWIDNKPIYRKTVVFTQIPDEGIIRIDKIFEDMEMIVSNLMFTEWYDMKADFSGNQLRGEAFISLQKEYVQFQLKNNPNYNYSAINSFTLTLEYTKKNDLPVV